MSLFFLKTLSGCKLISFVNTSHPFIVNGNSQHFIKLLHHNIILFSTQEKINNLDTFHSNWINPDKYRNQAYSIKNPYPKS